MKKVYLRPEVMTIASPVATILTNTEIHGGGNSNFPYAKESSCEFLDEE